MTTLISSFITVFILIGLVKSQDRNCTQTSPESLANGKNFVIDEGFLLGYECNDGYVLSTQKVVHELECFFGEWGTLDITCDSGSHTADCTERATTPVNAESVILSGTTNQKIAAFRCLPNNAWFSERITRISQCIDGSWQTINDICETSCIVPKHCGDVYDLGLHNSGFYFVTPTGLENRWPNIVFCDQTGNNHLGGGWTRVLKICDNNTDSFIQTKDLYTLGISSEIGGAYNFIGLNFLSELSKTYINEKLTLSITFENGNGTVYHATYSDFSIGPEPNYTLNSIGEYHGTAGDGLCAHVNEPFDFGTNETSARWWGAEGITDYIQQMNGSFLTKMMWAPLSDMPKAYSCIIMRVRPASYEEDKYCPPEIGFEPWWKTTIVNMPLERSPGTTITFDCVNEITRATNNDENTSINDGVITCSENSPHQWSPNITLPCTAVCPHSYQTSADFLKCFYFSTEAETRIGAIYRCMEEQATLTDFSIDDDVDFAENTDYHWISDVYGTYQSESEGEDALIRPTDTGFVCSSHENTCQASSSHKCTAITKGKYYGHFNCSTNNKYICQLPGICPYGFRPVGGGCYSPVERKETYKTALSHCNNRGAALVWLTTVRAAESLAIFIGNEFEQLIKQFGSATYLIGNNNADGTWDNSGVYPAMEAKLQELMKINESGTFRVFTVTNAHGGFEIIPANYSREEQAICQFNGPVGCKTQPPPEAENMVREYDGTMFVGKSVATYSCTPGYFFYGNISKPSISSVCMGQLGEWTTSNITDCERIEVCNSSTIRASSYMIPETNSDSLYLGGNITYFCPPNMTKIDNSRNTTTTCIPDPKGGYKFDITEITDCNVCVGEIELQQANMTVSRNSPDTYTVGFKVNATCPRNYEYELNENVQSVLCNHTGWNISHIVECYPVCQKPPLPDVESNMIAENMTINTVGTILNYTCKEDHFIRPETVGTEPAAYTKLICLANHTWEVTNELNCSKICRKPPPKPLENSHYSWDGISFQVNSEVVYNCTSDYHFPNLSTRQIVKCNESHWTPHNEEEFTCKQYCIENQPKPITTSNLTTTANTNTTDSQLVSNVITYSCPKGMFVKPTKINETIVSDIKVTCNSSRIWETDESLYNAKCDYLCKDDPVKAPVNATSSWDKFIRSNGTKITYTCINSTLFGNYNQTWEVSCDGTSWGPYDQQLFKCSSVCLEKPPVQIGNATHTFESEYGLPNEKIIYRCPEGLANITKTTMVTIQCTDNGWTEISNFACENMCVDNPPKPQSNSNYTFDGNNSIGAEVSYYCEGGFLGMGNSLTIYCIANGTWSMTILPNCLNVTVEIPKLSVPQDGLFYDETAYYFQDHIYNMDTLDGVPLSKTKSVIPLENGAVFQQGKEQCALAKDFFLDNAACVHNGAMCPDGFSFTIWVNMAEPEDNNINASRTILSTGGDVDGSPGIRVYQIGYYTMGIVSTGEQYWKVVAYYHMPFNGNWTALSFKWTNETGLEMYILDRRNGSMLLLAETRNPTSVTAQLGLNPPQLMLGCHSTGTDPKYRDFVGECSLDAFVVWREPVVNTEKFLGGFQMITRNFQEIMKILSKIPKTPENVNAIASEAITAQKQSLIDEGTVDTTSTRELTSTSTGFQIPINTNTENHINAIVIIEALSQMEDCPSYKIDNETIIGYLKILKLLDPLLTLSDENKVKWFNLYKKNHNIDPVNLISKLASFIECILQRVDTKMETTYLEEMYTQNICTMLTKEALRDLYKKHKYIMPPKKQKMKEPCEEEGTKVLVWPEKFNDDRCINRSMSTTLNIYPTLDVMAEMNVNEVDIHPESRIEFDSNIVAIKINVDPEFFPDKSISLVGPNCDFGNQEGYFLQIYMIHKIQKPAIPKRKPLFYEEEEPSEIVSRMCAQFNTKIGMNGKWDISTCKIVKSTSTYTRCACKSDGVFTILAEKKKPIIIMEEANWLVLAKYVLYGVSIFLLCVYIIVVMLSGDLKDQFHLIGLNLSVAVLFGSISIVISDFNFIRESQEICGGISSLIYFFYLSVGTWSMSLGHSSFKAITSGVIRGKLYSYIFMSWGFSLTGVGLIHMFFLHDIGTDPRCFVAWENDVKLTLLGPQAVFACIAFLFCFIILCNLSTPALRKDNLVDDYGSFCRGAAFVMFTFGLTWIFAVFAFIRADITTIDFHPIFTVLNSSLGLFVFLFIGLGSNRFRTVITGQAKQRRAMLKNYAFGLPGRKNKAIPKPSDQPDDKK